MSNPLKSPRLTPAARVCPNAQTTLLAFIPDIVYKVTYYHDSSCSQLAEPARLNDCDGYSDGSKLKSFSWDC